MCTSVSVHTMIQWVFIETELSPSLMCAASTRKEPRADFLISIDFASESFYEGRRMFPGPLLVTKTTLTCSVRGASVGDVCEILLVGVKRWQGLWSVFLNV